MKKERPNATYTVLCKDKEISVNNERRKKTKQRE
jgi:hypothetical protein